VADADTLPLKTYANLFLAALPPKELGLLQTDLRLVEFPRSTTLYEAGEQIDDVLFIESGMVSLLTTMSDGAAIENATLGRESILGVLGALGSHRIHMRAVVQIPVTGWRIRAADFRVATDRSRHLAVRRPTVTLIAQGLQNAGLISYRRGRIEILDREGLERQACECVSALRIKMRRILSELD